MAKGVKTGGRKKGTPNKITGELKEMILGALDEVGGREYLVRQANENPSAFLTLVGKILPHQLAAGGDGGLTVVIDRSCGGVVPVSAAPAIPLLADASGRSFRPGRGGNGYSE